MPCNVVLPLNCVGSSCLLPANTFVRLPELNGGAQNCTWAGEGSLSIGEGAVIECLLPYVTSGQVPLPLHCRALRPLSVCPSTSRHPSLVGAANVWPQFSFWRRHRHPAQRQAIGQQYPAHFNRTHCRGTGRGPGHVGQGLMWQRNPNTRLQLPRSVQRIIQRLLWLGSRFHWPK